MSTGNLVLLGLLLLICMSLVTSRQQQRLDFAATERAQAQARRLEQDFQNLTAKQQQLEQTERIERIARQERHMERIPAARTVFLTQTMQVAQTAVHTTAQPVFQPDLAMPATQRGQP